MIGIGIRDLAFVETDPPHKIARSTAIRDLKGNPWKGLEQRSGVRVLVASAHDNSELDFDF